MRGVGIHGTCLAGLLLIVYGCWLAWPPLSFVVAGALLCAFGLFVHRNGKSKGSK